MREVPDCLNRRFKALDELIRELSSETIPGSEVNHNDEPGVKLMCDFWNILKEDPDCNLTQAVKERLGINQTSSGFVPRHFTCYMAGKDDIKSKASSCKCSAPKTSSKESSSSNRPKSPYKTPSSESKKCMSVRGSKTSSELNNKAPPKCSSTDSMPLSKVLCNLKEAASFDKRCNHRIMALMAAQKDLKDQIQKLEDREKASTKLLKEADCMWTCMEESYKKKLNNSQQKQQVYLAKIKEAEKSNAKWRQNNKEVEIQLQNIKKCHDEILEKIHQKTNDMKCIETEIAGIKKKIEINKKETETVKNSQAQRKRASDVRIHNITVELNRINGLLREEIYKKKEKEKEGVSYIKAAREDIQKISKVLLQKRLINEDLKAEKEALASEIELLNQTMDACKERCQNRQKNMSEELKKIDIEIKSFKNQCIKCHQCTDTHDARKLCSDCPRCVESRECKVEGEHCEEDPTMDCVCMSVKQKFLDNVFDNMSTVLARKVKTAPAKTVAECILKCLKTSKNGKLDADTRGLLQEFILSTVKNNLNLTIIGGAVKTRCEMDPETYNQLMLCLKQVKAAKVPKTDRGTVAKKEACKRWGGTSECNCPKGPKSCICSARAPPAPGDSKPDPPPDPEDQAERNENQPRQSSKPRRGPECSKGGPGFDGWEPGPCDPSSCYNSRMQAQCLLETDSRSSHSFRRSSYKTTSPLVPNLDDYDNMTSCECRKNRVKPCNCKDIRGQPREQIIEEVLGKYTDVSSIEKVTSTDVKIHGCICSVRSKNKFSPNRCCDCSSKWIVLNGTDALKAKLKKKRVSHVYRVNRNITLSDSGRDLNKIKSQHCDASISVMPKCLKGPERIDKYIYAAKRTYHKCPETCSNESIVSNIFNNFIKNAVVTESNDKNKYGPDVDWITVDSLLKQISCDNESLNDESSISNQEVEVKSVTLGTTKNMKSKDKELRTRDNKSSDQSTCAKISEKSLTDSTVSGYCYTDFNYDHESNERHVAVQKMKPIENTRLQVSEEVIQDLYYKDLGTNTDFEKILGSQTNSNASMHKIEARKHNIYNELRKTFDKGGILLRVHREMGSPKEILAPLYKTKSNDIIININELLLFGRVIFEPKEQPILLKRSISGTFVLNLAEKTDISNAVLKNTASENLLIIVENTDNNFTDTAIRKSKEEFYNLKIKENNLTRETIVIKETASHNYTVVLDKEFEKLFKKAVKDSVDDNIDYFINLNRTKSDNYEMSMSSSNDKNKSNAIFVKSGSGNIKIITNKSDLKAYEKSSIKRKRQDGFEVFSKLLNKLSFSNSSAKKDTVTSKRMQLCTRKSSSESNLYKKSDHKDLLSEPSVFLKKKASGQYAVILEKSSKKAFINNLRNYISRNNAQGNIPIKRKENGEITIDLANGRYEFKSDLKYGTLRITPSGNIYVTINESEFNSLTKNKCQTIDKIISTINCSSCYMIDKLENPTDKSTTTHCYSSSNIICDCDKSKCVCSELRFGESKWTKVDSYPFDKFEQNVEKFSKDLLKYTKIENCCNRVKKGTQKTPPVFLKSFKKTCSSSLIKYDKKCPKSESVTVPDDLIEISEPCNKSQNPDSLNSKPNCCSFGTRTKVTYDWDSLEYLPPQFQLPHFLRPH